MRYFFLLLSILCSIGNLFGQDRLIKLNLEGKEYEDVSLFSPTGKITIKGNSSDGASWEFPVSEEDYSKMMTFEFTFDGNSNNKMTFYYVQDEDTLKTTSLGIDIVELNATYSFSYPYEIPVLVAREGINHTEMSTCTMDVYFVAPEKNSYSELSFKYLFFCFFQDRNGYPKKYEDFLEEYGLICQTYPESQFLLARLWALKSRFRLREDLRTLLELLSVEKQNSYYGEMIKEYLKFDEKDFYFENIRLRECISLEKEYIITNPEKHTLIIFSAWWCGPCHALLPRLRKIYEDVKDRIDFVYVSIDKEATFPRWQNYIREEDIPWLCVWLNDEDKDSPGVGLMEKYYISALPGSLLVSPGGRSRHIEVRKEEDRNFLYGILKED